MSDRSHSAPASPARRSALLWTALFVLAVLAFSGAITPSQAEDKKEPKVDIAYVSVLGHEQNARAWYTDSPSTGVRVQDALDHYAKLGYVVVAATNGLRTTAQLDEVAFAIVLQRVR